MEYWNIGSFMNRIEKNMIYEKNPLRIEKTSTKNFDPNTEVIRF
jgi:hypothetical protein